jgi:branched-chain amino acid transport system ATP-binding protein
MSALLSVSDAHVSYGKVEAVRSVSLDVADNEIVTIIGANGAGKTTLLNAIMGVLPLKGGAAFAGEDMAPLDIEDRVAAGLSLVPEHRELFGTMNVEDNLQLGAFRIPKATAAKSFEKVYALFPRLKERRKQLAGTLSGGEQQMLAMGRALMGAPKLLMLDEPSLGLAPIIVADIFRTIGELRAAGVSVLLVEQNAQAALKIADRAYVMELGEFDARAVVEAVAILFGEVVDALAGRDLLFGHQRHGGSPRGIPACPALPSSAPPAPRASALRRRRRNGRRTGCGCWRRTWLHRRC